MGITHRKFISALPHFIGIARSNHGFTLIELLIVMSVIGVLASISLPAVYEFRNKARTSRAATEIRGLEKDIISWASEKGSYPTLGEVANDAANPALTTLKNLKDPWGNNYEYNPACTRRFGTYFNSDFDLYSKGPNGVTVVDDLNHPFSLDDIVRFRDGAFDDVAEKLL